MRHTDDYEQIEMLENSWWYILGIAWILFVILIGWMTGYWFITLIGLYGSKPICKALKSPAGIAAQQHFQWKKSQEANLNQQKMEATIRQATTQTETQRVQTQRAFGHQEVITRLGAIDNYVRLLETETDPSRRIVAFQAAHGEVVALEAKRVSGNITDDVMSNSDVLAHARATSNHLARLGLASDRLNLEIVRLFRLSA